jgi:hypothetical protein
MMKTSNNKRVGNLLIIAIICFLCANRAYALELTDNAGRKTETKQQNPAKSDTITLPRIEYRSDGLRDPFEGVFKKELTSNKEIKETKQEPAPTQPPGLTVQGIILGSKMDQAIINDKLVKTGDTIEGAEVRSISKDGVEIIFKNRTFKLPSPAAAQLQSLKIGSKGGQDEK